MRGKQAPTRSRTTDERYNNLMVERLIRLIMTRGKKSLAQRLVYDAFEVVKEQTKRDPVAVFDEAMRNVSPVIEVKARRIGGSNYQIPIEVRGERRVALGLRWLIGAARSRKGKSMDIKLADEIILAAKKEGMAVKKREDVHRMADANRAFAHFALR